MSYHVAKGVNCVGKGVYTRRKGGKVRRKRGESASQRGCGPLCEMTSLPLYPSTP
jgi:hypothetical protein